MEVETFWTLLHNAPHWEFELFVGFVEMLIFDILIGAFVWPILKKRFKHQHCNECDCKSRVDALEEKMNKIEERV